MKRSEKREYLKQYKGIARFIHKFAGPNCEVIIRDYHNDESEIIDIWPGEFTGRKVSNQLKGFLLDRIANNDYKHNKFIANYLLVSSDDKRILRASTYYICHEGELCGLLCVNYDLTPMLQFRDYVNDKMLFGICDDRVEQINDTGEFVDLDQFVEKIIENTFTAWDRSIPVQKVENEHNPIRVLYKRGVFSQKGSVNRVADLLDISPQTVYRYLKIIEEDIAKEDD